MVPAIRARRRRRACVLSRRPVFPAHRRCGPCYPSHRAQSGPAGRGSAEAHRSLHQPSQNRHAQMFGEAPRRGYARRALAEGQHAQSSPRKTPLFIIGGIAAVAALVAAIFVFTGGGDGPLGIPLGNDTPETPEFAFKVQKGPVITTAEGADQQKAVAAAAAGLQGRDCRARHLLHRGVPRSRQLAGGRLRGGAAGVLRRRPSRGRAAARTPHRRHRGERPRDDPAHGIHREDRGARRPQERARLGDRHREVPGQRRRRIPALRVQQQGAVHPAEDRRRLDDRELLGEPRRQGRHGRAGSATPSSPEASS